MECDNFEVLLLGVWSFYISWYALKGQDQSSTMNWGGRQTTVWNNENVKNYVNYKKFLHFRKS